MNPWLSPVALLVAAFPLLLLGLLARRRGVQALALLIMLAGLAGMTPIVANALVGVLERHADPEPGECDGIEAMVLLAGGLQRPAGGARDFGALTWGSLQRGFAYLDLGHRRELPLLVAGGSRDRVPEAEVLGLLVGQLGLDAEAIMLETMSLTTHDNAIEARRLLPPPLRRIGLATSAVHMPRARRAFTAAGFEVCRVPLDRLQVEVSGPWAFWPQSSSLRKTEAALHELAGDLWYRWRARR